ncbi:AraC family transcriptional regulator [Pedobacter ginsengiterrae]|uniref:AraC family transcriptional regulator n=1 Tax=Pedobacter ginsengiterrae TaxID=871696 RepID=A0ABP7PWG0_9SPHI
MLNRLSQQRYSLLNVDVVELTSNWSYRGIISPYTRIYYIGAGLGQLSDATGNIKLEKGYIYLVPSYTMCDMLCKDKLTQYYVQFFDDLETGSSLFQNIKSIAKVSASDLDFQLFQRLIEINPERGITKSYDPKTYENELFYNDCQQKNLRQNSSTFYETLGIIQQLSSRFLNFETHHTRPQSVQSSNMVDTVTYILKHLDSDLSVSSLAARVDQNVDYFSRQFKKHTGIRPLNFLVQKRIERAQYMMATTALNYTEIALHLRFDNLSYFSKTFKKITGLSPGTYKKQIYLAEFSVRV